MAASQPPQPSSGINTEQQQLKGRAEDTAVTSPHKGIRVSGGFPNFLVSLYLFQVNSSSRRDQEL